MHETYLPFSEQAFGGHFAKVKNGKGGDHLAYYRASLKKNREFERAVAAGLRPTSQQIRHGRQLEKDERFWVAAALMGLCHASDAADLFGRLMERAEVLPPNDFASWPDAFAGPLHLYFEVSLPSPRAYQTWLRDHVDDRVTIPYLREAAAAAPRLEGSTKADAVLVAPGTGITVVFEAKVLSDVSTTVRFDVARNQLARIIDVTLDQNPLHVPPLNDRKPERTYTMLLTPRLFHPRGPTPDGHRSRLYGWLVPQYRNPASPLLARHLLHRTGEELVGSHHRLGWATWEDVNEIRPGSCAWLPPS
jgi:hypothetical protein